MSKLTQQEKEELEELLVEVRKQVSLEGVDPKVIKGSIALGLLEACKSDYKRMAFYAVLALVALTEQGQTVTE